MKMLKNMFLCVALAAFGLFVGCKEEGPGVQTIPFEATFFTVLVGFEEDAGCAPPNSFLNTQQGSGSATLIGNFTTELTFCVNPATFEYNNVQGSFVAENGDEIFITGGGQVLPSDEPGYDLEFMDPFEIIGGTGPFKGATGGGMTNSFVSNATGQTDHVWTGEITLIK